MDPLGDFISNFLCEGVDVNGIVGGEGQGDERGGGTIWKLFYYIYI